MVLSEVFKMESFLRNTSLFWLCLTALFAFLELFFLRYRLIWFSVGGTGGLFCSLFGTPFWVQIAVFVLLGGSLLWFCRNWVRHVRCEDALTDMDDALPKGISCEPQIRSFDPCYDSEALEKPSDSVEIAPVPDF